MCAPSTCDHFQKSYSEISLACADSQAFCRADITLHQLNKYLAGKGDLGKYNALEKAIGYEILYMCVTPGKKNTTIYEMIPADMLDEATDTVLKNRCSAPVEKSNTESENQTQGPKNQIQGPKNQTQGPNLDSAGSFANSTGSFANSTGSFANSTGSFANSTGSFTNSTGGLLGNRQGSRQCYNAAPAARCSRLKKWYVYNK
jgi:hypothetical protein